MGILLSFFCIFYKHNKEQDLVTFQRWCGKSSPFSSLAGKLKFFFMTWEHHQAAEVTASISKVSPLKTQSLQ